MLRWSKKLQRCFCRRNVGHCSTFGKFLTKEQQLYTSNYVLACAFEPPQVSHVCFHICSSKTSLFSHSDQVRQLIESRIPPLPEISISAAQGMFLQMLAQSAPKKTFIEVGTLGGYSAAWLACAFRSGECGMIHTLERDSARAVFAQQALHSAGFGSLVNVLNEPALDAIPKLCQSMERHSAGLVFLDATKSEYIAYFQLLEDLVAPVR
jgi:predicted O-methyltransferase YrrM